MKHGALLAVLPLVFGTAAILTDSSAGGAPAGPVAPSTYVGTATVGTTGMPSKSDGDLWPSCWAGNGNVYATNGDGKGFSLDQDFADIAVNEIKGDVGSLSGTTIARGDQVGSIWSGAGYNRKPTGMVCVGDTLYLAVQDLALDFNDVPAATIAKSTDHGRTWTWDKRKPMFSDHVFTTIWFADFGKGGAAAPDGYVYAYGLDGNWRDSFDDTVADPQDVFMARVPKAKVQDRTGWEFYTGSNDRGKPSWSGKVADRKPVLTDQRRLYPQTYGTNASNLSVISQGGVTYLPQQKRYVYTSWTEYTFEFYESPTPWGPWKHFLSKDFGGYPWTTSKYGGYGVTIPSKFLQPDGKTVYLQANVCPCGGGGIGTSVYNFNLRKMVLTPSSSAPATDLPSDTNLAAPTTGAVAISKSSQSGSPALLNDGATTGSESDFDDEVKGSSWWGYTWPAKHKVNRVDFTSGAVSAQGGWFTGRPRVQVKQNGSWIEVGAQTVSPAYPGDASAGANTTFTLTFPPVETDGVRVIGLPGGTRGFTTVSEVAIRYAAQLADGGFEGTGGGKAAWSFEGSAFNGVDRGLGFAHSGANNGWIRTSGTGWSALTQTVPVTPGTKYTFGSWINASANLPAGDGRFGVRLGADGSQVMGEKTFGASTGYVHHEVSVTIPAGVHEVTVYAAFTAPGLDTFIQVDDFTVS
ncbi:DUF4185 domain-containing protein [Kribbella sp. VKM Ac-2568]|uniref:DUF4185 domain-containing protein n=1 Tax=Kribbella sp. VKM Ac-2568 TaxID=2512219 RepID=UPI0010505E30|nr:DUF4185 domain-containing protein [Kribbella sp. VKM Ac-2568]TCM47963.1 hypothetical protein EV648_104358 [Kribbella sp. VKM Ac-2568]